MRGAAPRARLATRCLMAASALLIASCSSDEDGGDDARAGTTVVPTPSTSAPAPEDCEGPTSLFTVASVLAGPAGSCRRWVDGSYGRALRSSTGSASVWSRRSEHGAALVVGAVHSLGLGWYGDAGTDVPEALVDPEGATGVPRLFPVRPDGSGPDDLASPWFPLYHPPIAAERNTNFLRDLLPSEDFYVAVMDSQKLDVDGPAAIAAPLTEGPVPIYDPLGVTTAVPTWAAVPTGDLVLLLGYPQATGEATAGVGRVLNDDEAEDAIALLARLDDPEGQIAYEADVEVIIEGAATAGMSGGPVVDRDGRLVGLLVRATDVHDGTQYVRAVRMSWVVNRLNAAFDGLAATEQAVLTRYLEPAG